MQRRHAAGPPVSKQSGADDPRRQAFDARQCAKDLPGPGRGLAALAERDGRREQIADKAGLLERIFALSDAQRDQGGPDIDPLLDALNVAIDEEVCRTRL